MMMHLWRPRVPWQMKFARKAPKLARRQTAFAQWAERVFRHGDGNVGTTQALMHQMSDHQAAISAMLDRVEADYKDE